MRVAALIRADLEQRDLLEPLTRIVRGKHVTVDDVLTEGRCPIVVAARFEFFVYLHNECGFSKRRIAMLFGMDRTSVLNGLRRAQVRAPHDAHQPSIKRTA